MVSHGVKVVRNGFRPSTVLTLGFPKTLDKAGLQVPPTPNTPAFFSWDSWGRRSAFHRSMPFPFLAKGRPLPREKQKNKNGQSRAFRRSPRAPGSERLAAAHRWRTPRRGTNPGT